MKKTILSFMAITFLVVSAFAAAKNTKALSAVTRGNNNSTTSVKDEAAIVYVHITNNGTEAHCDFTVTEYGANGSYITYTGHIVGMWCIDFFAGQNVRFV